jgi:hypothetical protein
MYLGSGKGLNEEVGTARRLMEHAPGGKKRKRKNKGNIMLKAKR